MAFLVSCIGVGTLRMAAAVVVLSEMVELVAPVLVLLANEGMDTVVLTGDEKP